MKAFSAVGIVLLPFLLAACNETTPSTDARTQPPLVRVGTVSTSMQAERSFTGIVAARVQSDLAFRVPGKVLERLVDTGQTVKLLFLPALYAIWFKIKPAQDEPAAAAVPTEPVTA